MSRLARVEIHALIGAGAVGAGVHAAIAPAHLREWAPLGAGFVAVAVGLAAAVVGVALRPGARRPVAALAVLLGTVAVGYLITRVAAIPPLDPEREPFDAVGLCTTAIEATGLLLALHVLLPRSRQTPIALRR